MTNHPNRSTRYYVHYPRNFSNEYTVGIAIGPAAKATYTEAGWERITRRDALKMLAKAGTNGWGETYYVGAEIDGVPTHDDARYVAQMVRAGTLDQVYLCK